MQKRIGGILAFLMIVGLAIAQQNGERVKYANNYTPPTKSQLEAEKKKIQDAIQETERQLDEIKKNKNATVSQLRVLQYKLAQRQTLIKNINDELEGIDVSINESSKEVVSLQQKLEILKTRYAQSIRYSYSTRSSYDMLAFLFSSSSFNDAVRRMKYLKKFREYRKQQVDQITQTQVQIEHKIGDLNKEKLEKDQLLNSQKQQSDALKTDVSETNNVIQSLKGKEAELTKKAEENKKVAARINKAINAIIEKEMAAARKRAEDEEKKRRAAEATKQQTTKDTKTNGKTEPAKTDNGGKNPNVYTNTKGETKAKKTTEDVPMLMTPTDVELANNFAGNKGKLYWPVAQGFIVDHFGVHQIPGTKVEEDMDGIVIQTPPKAAVRAVFEGTVSSVIVVEGMKIVMVEHGNYFTVYNNLSSTSVQKGDHVKTLQTIGVVGENFEGEPQMKFQVWRAEKKGSSKLNPEQWIGRAK